MLSYDKKSNWLLNYLSSLFFNVFLSFLSFGYLPYISVRTWPWPCFFHSQLSFFSQTSQLHQISHLFLSQMLSFYLHIYNYRHNSSSIAYGTKILSLEVFHQEQVLALFYCYFLSKHWLSAFQLHLIANAFCEYFHVDWNLPHSRFFFLHLICKT